MNSLPRALPFIDATECAQHWETIRSLRTFWIPRHPNAPSFTLGAACYLDVPDYGTPEYLRRVVRNNKILLRRFRPLYEKLQVAIELALGAPVGYSTRYALPGFHVFEAGEALDELDPKLHFDLQDLDLEWDGGNARVPNGRISFTVPIVIPRSGAALDVWELEVDPQGRAVTPEEAAAIPRTRHEYTTGELFLHTGDRLHQIVGDRALGEGEARVTMQGHGRLTQGLWILYW